MNPYESPNSTDSGKPKFDWLCALGAMLIFTCFFWLLGASGQIKTESEIGGWVIATNHTRWAVYAGIQAVAGCVLLLLGTSK